MSSPFVPDDDAVSSSDTSGSTDTGAGTAADAGLSAAEGSEPVGAIRLDDPPRTRRPRPQFTVQAAKTAARDGVAATRRRTRDWLDRPMTSFHLLMAVFFLLLGFGLLMVLSSSSVVAYSRDVAAGGDGSVFGTFKKQLLFAAVGLVAFYAAMRVKLNWLRAMSTTAMLVSLALLVIVLGMNPLNGARSWISIGPIGFQPSELAKFTLVIWGANVLASRRANLGSWKELLIPVLPVALLMGALIMLEPDLGTTAALMVIVFALFFFAGASWKMFGALIVTGVGALVLLAVIEPYRMKRVVSFLNPEEDALGSGLQLLQGLYGMADGGWFGVGLGQSRAKWAYLPHAESDFIFAIVGEELGFLGAGLLIALYVTLALVGLRIARRNIDPFIKLVSATSTAWLVGQAAINIFYVIGLLPVTGLTLPMISAGGTSLLVTMTIFGLLANFARREPQAVAALEQSGPGAISRFFGIGVPGADAATSKRAQLRAERKQNRQWARTSARKAVDERKTQKAAARVRPVDNRDPRLRATERHGRPTDVPSGRPGATGGSRPRRPSAGPAATGRPGRPSSTGRPDPGRPTAAERQAAQGPARQAPARPGPARSGSAPRTAGRPDPAARRHPEPARSGGIVGWLGFGGAPKPAARPAPDSARNRSADRGEPGRGRR